VSHFWRLANIDDAPQRQSQPIKAACDVTVPFLLT
jgi:hypothetical protein